MALPFVRACSMLVAATVICATGWRGAADALAEPSESERSLLLTVLDDKGAPMKDLRTEQFIVLEDGEMRPVTSSRVATEPLSVVLLVDMTQPVYGQSLNARDIRSAVSAFVTTVHAAQPETRIQLLEVAGAPRMLVKFSTDTEELIKSAQRMFQNQQGDSPTIEAVVDAARDLRGEESPRRVIISVDRDSPDPSRVRPEDVTKAIDEAGAAVWAISIREAGRGSPTREEMLSFLTQETGGTFQTARVLTPLEGMLTRLAQALTHQYVITYTRPDGAAVDDVLAGTTTAGTVLVSEMMER